MMDVVIKIRERKKLAFKWIVLRVSIKPEGACSLERRQSIIPKRVSRDAFLCDLCKACVDLWHHLYRLIRRRVFVALISRIALVVLITFVSLVSVVSLVGFVRRRGFILWISRFSFLVRLICGGSRALRICLISKQPRLFRRVVIFFQQPCDALLFLRGIERTVGNIIQLD